MEQAKEKVLDMLADLIDTDTLAEIQDLSLMELLETLHTEQDRQSLENVKLKEKLESF